MPPILKYGEDGAASHSFIIHVTRFIPYLYPTPTLLYPSTLPKLLDSPILFIPHPLCFNPRHLLNSSIHLPYFYPTSILVSPSTLPKLLDSSRTFIPHPHPLWFNPWHFLNSSIHPVPFIPHPLWFNPWHFLNSLILSYFYPTPILV